MIQVNCPQCGQSVEWKAENVFRPFCSKRCQLIDLGEWANEKHHIPVCDEWEELDSSETESPH